MSELRANIEAPPPLGVGIALLMFLFVGMHQAEAQVVRLPEVTPGAQPGPQQMAEPSWVQSPAAGQPVQFSQPPAYASPLGVLPPSEILLDSPPPQLPVFVDPLPDIPPDARDGVFQKLTFTSTWISSGGSEGLGFTDLDLRMVLGLPAPTRRAPLALVPGFTVRYVDWPHQPDLPARLYDAYVQFRWMYRFNPKLRIEFGGAPGVYGDFDQSVGDAFRFPAYGAATYTVHPRLQIVLGAAYLDRPDIVVLPVGGVIWKPNDDLLLELVSPRPKIAQRIYWVGACREGVEDWVYVAGEFGGSAWAVQRADMTDDVLLYSDYRILFGLERKDLYGLDARIEVGYVFGREFKYEIGREKVDPSDAILLRAGLTY